MVVLVDRPLGPSAALGRQGGVADQAAQRLGQRRHVVRLVEQPAAGGFDQLAETPRGPARRPGCRWPKPPARRAPWPPAAPREGTSRRATGGRRSSPPARASRRTGSGRRARGLPAGLRSRPNRAGRCRPSSRRPEVPAAAARAVFGQPGKRLGQLAQAPCRDRCGSRKPIVTRRTSPVSAPRSPSPGSPSAGKSRGAAWPARFSPGGMTWIRSGSAARYSAMKPA